MGHYYVGAPSIPLANIKCQQMPIIEHIFEIFDCSKKSKKPMK